MYRITQPGKPQNAIPYMNNAAGCRRRATTARSSAWPRARLCEYLISRCVQDLAFKLQTWPLLSPTIPAEDPNHFIHLMEHSLLVFEYGIPRSRASFPPEWSERARQENGKLLGSSKVSFVRGRRGLRALNHIALCTWQSIPLFKLGGINIIIARDGLFL